MELSLTRTQRVIPVSVDLKTQPPLSLTRRSLEIVITAYEFVRDNMLPPWLEAAKPDIVLFQIGWQDMLNFENDEILGSYSTMVKQMREYNPRMKILVCFLPRLVPCFPDIDPSKASMLIPTAYVYLDHKIFLLDSAMPGWGAALNSTHSPLWVVNTYEGYSGREDNWNGVTPAESGNRKLAERYTAALKTALAA